MEVDSALGSMVGLVNVCAGDSKRKQTVLVVVTAGLRTLRAEQCALLMAL
jgi:hypothetical protein